MSAALQFEMTPNLSTRDIKQSSSSSVVTDSGDKTRKRQSKRKRSQIRTPSQQASASRSSVRSDRSNNDQFYPGILAMETISNKQCMAQNDDSPILAQNITSDSSDSIYSKVIAPPTEYQTPYRLGSLQYEHAKSATFTEHPYLIPSSEAAQRKSCPGRISIGQVNMDNNDDIHRANAYQLRSSFQENKAESSTDEPYPTQSETTSTPMPVIPPPNIFVGSPQTTEKRPSQRNSMNEYQCPQGDAASSYQARMVFLPDPDYVSDGRPTSDLSFHPSSSPNVIRQSRKSRNRRNQKLNLEGPTEHAGVVDLIPLYENLAYSEKLNPVEQRESIWDDTNRKYQPLHESIAIGAQPEQFQNYTPRSPSVDRNEIYCTRD